jgi:hypothetical protein
LGESTKSRKRRSSNRRICSEDWPEDLPRVPASWKHRSIPDLDAAVWSSVGALFRLPWFRRVWIIQEIVGAPHVKIVCGKWIIDWNDLHLAMEIIDREVQMSDDDFSHLKSSWEPIARRRFFKSLRRRARTSSWRRAASLAASSYIVCH